MFCLQSSSYGPPSEVHSNRETSGWRSRLSATCLFQILVGKSGGPSVGLAVSSGKGKSGGMTTGLSSFTTSVSASSAR